MKLNSLIYSFFAFSFLFMSCSKSDEETPAQPQEYTGKITGRVMAKNGLKPVGGATVFVLGNAGKVYYAKTDATGNFTFDAPEGSRDLNIQTGGGANFRTTLHVNIVKGQTLSLDPAQTRLDQIANMAYVAGTYDNIETIVTDLGYTITALTNADLLNYNTISQYDVIFLNCGAKEGNTNQTVMDTNLANFVTNGGSLYASDWAVAYLTGGNTHSIVCNETYGFIPDAFLCTNSTGSTSTITGAQVTDTDLATALGFSNLDVTYDLPSWEQITNYDPNFWDVMVANPANNAALMIKTKDFSGGTVTVPVGRTAEEEDWITICHHETDGESITLTIPLADWPIHEAHGDSLGECSNSNNSGTIYYTTFHNHAGGNVSNTTLILQYLILNL